MYWGITYTKMSSNVNSRVFSIYFIKGIPWSTFKVVALVNLYHHLSWGCFAKLYYKWTQRQCAQCSKTNHPQSNVDSPSQFLLILPFFETSNKFHNFYQVVQFWPNFRILKFRFSCFVLWEWAKTRPQVLSEIISFNLTCNIFLDVETSSLRCYLYTLILSFGERLGCHWCQIWTSNNFDQVPQDGPDWTIFPTIITKSHTSDSIPENDFLI